MKVNVTSVVNQNIRLDINREFLDIFLGSGYTPSNVRLKRFHPIAKSILTSFPTLNNLLLNVFERSKPANHIFTKEKRKVIFTKISSRKLQAAKFVQSSPKLRKSSKIVTEGCIVRHASTRTRSLAERILRATLSSRSLRIPAIVRKPSPFLSKLLIAGNLQVLFRDDACNSNRLFDSTKESEKK